MRRTVPRRLLLFVCITLLGGCAESTAPPLATVAPVTATPALAVEPTRAAPLRYGLHPNTVDALPERDQILAAVDQLEDLPPDFSLQGFDIIAGYGTFDGWQRSPTALTIGLIVAPEFIPPNQAAQIIAALDPDALIAAINAPGAENLIASTGSPDDVRQSFAAGGRPDGLTTTLAVSQVPGGANLAAQLTAMNVRVRLTPLDDAALSTFLLQGRAGLALVAWHDSAGEARWQQAFGAEAVFPLLRLPISYLATDGLTITFTPGGWPLPSRPG